MLSPSVVFKGEAKDFMSSQPRRPKNTTVLTLNLLWNVSLINNMFHFKIVLFWINFMQPSWRILTNKEIYGSVRKPTIIETIRLNRLCWFGHVQRMEENRIPKRVLYMNLVTTRLRGRTRNRWQDEVREDGRIVGGEGWQEKYITERNGGSSWERQGIVAFCICQWNEWMNQVGTENW